MKEIASRYNKNTRYLYRSVMTALLFVVIFLVMPSRVQAQTAEEVAATIEAYNAGLTAEVNANTVTVTGSAENVTTGLVLELDDGMTVDWRAKLTSSDLTSPLIKCEHLGNSASFIINDGAYLSSKNPTFRNNSSMRLNVIVNGGTIYSESGIAIDAFYQLTVNGGTIGTGTGTAIGVNNGGVLYMNGGYAYANSGSVAEISNIHFAGGIIEVKEEGGVGIYSLNNFTLGQNATIIARNKSTAIKLSDESKVPTVEGVVFGEGMSYDFVPANTSPQNYGVIINWESDDYKTLYLEGTYTDLTVWGASPGIASYEHTWGVSGSKNIVNYRNDGLSGSILIDREPGSSGGSSEPSAPESPSTPTVPAGESGSGAGENAGQMQVVGSEGTSGWAEVAAQITSEEAAGDNDNVEVLMNGNMDVDKSTFEALRGNDKNLIFHMGNDVSWTINGLNIPGTELKNLDLGVERDSDAIEESVANQVNEGSISVIQLSLHYSGEFGLPLTMNIKIDAAYEGKYANLYYYNPSTGMMEFITSDRIHSDGNADLVFTHASDYLIVVSDVETKTELDDVPKTGETSTPFGWLILIASASGMCVILLHIKENKLLQK